MVYHILNGEALTDRFIETGINGEIIITRECLVDGNLEGDSLQDFFHTRAKYLAEEPCENEQDYFAWVVNEFEKIMRSPADSEFNLWFGYDLFCRANMWFILSLLYDMEIKKDVYIVYPSYLAEADRWKDFGGATPADLQKCFSGRTRLDENDIELGKNLWIAFKKNDFNTLQQLAAQAPLAFPYLQEVCNAHIERFPENGGKSRPEKIIEDIIVHTSPKFSIVFPEFFKREGIYGFGDTQVKKIYDKVMQSYPGSIDN